MTYTPHIPNNIPFLRVPENRVNIVFAWYQQKIDHPNNFPAYAYWIERCTSEGSDY